MQGGFPTAFIPLGCIVTLSGTGAEQNAGGVITDEARKTKGAFWGALPAWAALDPAYTLTVPMPQFMSGAFDSLSHCMETYFGTPRERCVSDDINFAIQRNIVRNMRAVAADEGDLQARSELVYDSAMGKDDLAVANGGIDALAAFIAEMGLPTTFAQMGSDASNEILRAVADTAVLTASCAKRLNRDEIYAMLAQCR